MQTPDGELIPGKFLRELADKSETPEEAMKQLQKELQESTGKAHPIFTVGEELTVKGGRYRVHNIRKNRLILKPIRY